MSDGGFIYALGTRSRSLVKIGSTCGSVEERKRFLQTGYPYPLETLAVVAVDGNRHLIEFQVQRSVAQTCQRLTGEWFQAVITQASLEQHVAQAHAALAHLTPQPVHVMSDTHASPMVPYPLEESLGDRIRKSRERHGMSQTELARRVRVSKQTMWEIESNRTPDPGALKVKAIAAILNVSTDYLLGMHEESCHA